VWISTLITTRFHRFASTTDSFNNRIRKVDSSGEISTVAGNGEAGFSGDGGPATEASLNGPSDVALDSAGNLFVVDSFNDRIRKVDGSGTITTFAGNGEGGESGDGGVATDASLFLPGGVFVGAEGNFYISDELNSRIRVVDTSGIISTLAGTGANSYSGDGGPATEAELWFPVGLFVDRTGDLYVADSVNGRIRRVGGIAFTDSESPLDPAADFNGDGSVEFSDFVAFAQNFGRQQENQNFDAKFDLNANGSVDFADFVIFARAFGR
jgi:sugar lactone lactonase YvrE